MARPRVFLSSTFYDLKQIRSDFERFVSEMGYEPILNERGAVPYGNAEKLEEYCYKEIELSDLLVAIVGGRYGSGSQHEPYSISQMELRTALNLGKQVYVFVERAVWSEYATYLNNKDLSGIRYRFVDNPKVYGFLEEIQALPINNQIATFESSQDIVDYLKEQWAGLFQRFLQETARLKEVRIIEGMQSTAQTLNQLVTFLTEERKSKDQAIREILLTNHPAFSRLRKVTKTTYRVFFTSRDELNDWLNARQYSPRGLSYTPEGNIEVETNKEGYEEWIVEGKKESFVLGVHGGIFEGNGKLKVFTADEWNDDWIVQNPFVIESGDDLPF